jgi:hypothetical protein
MSSHNEADTAVHPSIEPQSVITIAPSAVGAPSETDCVVHNLQTGATYRLNDIGARIWEWMESDRHTVGDIVARLQTEYRLPEGVTSQQIEKDVIAIAQDLHQFGLIVLDPPSRHADVESHTHR